MGLSDCIPHSLEDYVDLAVRLGTNPGARAEFRDRLRMSSPVLFEDEYAVMEHERIFNELLQRIGS